MSQKEDERYFLEQIRREASDVKTCFTNFSFQAIAFSSAALALMFGTMKVYPMAVFAAIPVIVLLMIVCRIGIFKYTTANRNYGYQLHLARIDILKLNSKASDNNYPYDLKLISWEEALKAWRVVQATAFREIYKTPENTFFARFINPIRIFNWLNHLNPFLYRFTKRAKGVVKIFKTNLKIGFINKNKEEYPWFMPKILTSFNIDGKIVSSYYAGTYLKNMMGLLLLMQYLLLVPMAILIYDRSDFVNLHFPVKWLVSFLFLLLIIFFRHFRINRRREILENELLSIHSCAIMWHAVVWAHFKALEKTKGLYQHYTEYLAALARNISKDIFKIHLY